MDNDGKVTDLVEQSKSVFLSDAVQDFRRRQSQYDLDAEFAKTRKNRTFVVPGVIIAMVLLFTSVAFAVNVVIERSSQIEEIVSGDFEQINLRDVLQAWLRTENRLEEIEDQIGRLEQERDERLELADQRAERDRRLARLRADAGMAVLGVELTRTQQALQTERQQIRLEYTGELESLADEREQILLRREQEFDQVQVNAALARRGILDDQRRLFDLELERQQEFLTERIASLRTAYQEELGAFGEHRDQVEFTLRQQFAREIAQLVAEHEAELEELFLLYNPDFSDEEIARLLEAPFFDEPAGSESEDFERALLEQGVLRQAELTELRNVMDELFEIVERLRDVPYENSVPDALDQILSRSQTLVAGLNRAGSDLARSFEESVDTLTTERDTASSELETVRRQLTETRRELSEVRTAAEERIASETEQLRARLSQFEHAFSELIQDDREDGYVVDPRDAQQIHIYLDPSRDVDEGVRAFVFRDPEGLIGTVEFFETARGFRARLLDLADNRSIRPFDRVLLDIAGRTDPAADSTD